jgi:penicillin amidase
MEHDTGEDAVEAVPDSGSEGDVATPPRRKSRRRRFLLVSLAVVLVLVLAAGVLAVVLVRVSFPQADGELRIAGLHGTVEVLRDDLGVPQIYADDSRDLFLAQGYVHAQDRFWEMDVRRHITAGRLSEMFGQSQVATDSVIRTMGWYEVARRELAMLSPSTRDYLGAYSAGVNAYLRDHDGAALSIEYAVLGLDHSGYRPESWSPADSVAWLKAVAWDLNTGIDTEIQRSLLAAGLSPAQVDQLYPPYDHTRFPSIVRGPAAPGPASAPGAAPATMPAEAGGGVPRVSNLRGVLTDVLGPTGPGIGSNSWVVSGSRTVTGKPMLANDPHLAPSMPGIWYQAGLHCTLVSAGCPFDVSGFGFAGMPGVIIGHNMDIAWGLTNVGADDSDLFLEKVTGDSYEYQGRQLPLTIRTETIAVAGGQPRTITVRSTRHGPLISDVLAKTADAAKRGRTPGISPDLPGVAVALQWTALEPSRTVDAIFALDLAKDWTGFRAAVSLFSSPAQNMIYADRSGNIGYQMSGVLPVRGSGDGSYPAPGWTGDHDWTGRVDFAQLPAVFNPPEGYIVTANNAAAGSGYAPLITKYWVPGYRAARITDLIERHSGKLDVATMTRLQLDDLHPAAAQLVPRLLATDPGEQARAAQNLLRGWDFRQQPDSAAAAYFNAVWRNLVRLTFGDELSVTPANAPSGSGRWFDLVHRIIDRPDDPWWRNEKDPRNLRTRDDVLRAALQDADAELRDRLGDDPTDWQWGALHTLTLKNQTLGVGGPGPVKWLLNAGPFPMAGGSDAVDATSWDAARGYEVTTGPSMRMVVDFAEFDRSRWVNLTGVSGHTFHTNYQDQTELWLRGETTEWAFGRPAVAAITRYTLRLLPAG